MVYLSIVNRDVHHPVDVSVEGLGRRREATLFTVSGESPLARNTPENPSARGHPGIDLGNWQRHD